MIPNLEKYPLLTEVVSALGEKKAEIFFDLVGEMSEEERGVFDELFKMVIDSVVSEKDTLIAWLLSSHTGISSKSIAAVMSGMKPADPWHAPSDPSDLGRCLFLLALFPNFDINRMRDVNTSWFRLVQHWDELKALWDEESPTGNCPKLYKRMQEIINNPEKGA